MQRDFPVVHAVTDTEAVEAADFMEHAEAVMRALGPRGALHLRSSRITGRRFFALAEKLVMMQELTDCWLIVNDRVDVAAGAGARGIQLAAHSMSIPDARTAAPGIPVGTSIHSVDEARLAQKEGAAWCVAGTIFETPSHAGRAAASLNFVREVCDSVSIPVIAIGGITPERIAEVLAAGAYGIATIRGAGWKSPTRPDVSAESGLAESISRYISAHDSSSGSERIDNAHSQRSSPAGPI